MKTYRMIIIALFAAAAALFQLLHGIIGIPTPFGMVIDLAAFPVLLAFFMFGFDAALSVCIVLTIIITLVSPESWLGASMKFAATLPMIMLPALWLLAGKKKTDPGRLGAILILSLAIPLLIFVFSGMINTSLTKNGTQDEVLYQVPEVTAGGSMILKASAITRSELLQGVAPIIGLALVSVLMLYLWRRYGKDVKTSSLSDPTTMVVVTTLALIVRGASMVIANYYYAGPVFFGLQPEQFMGLFPWYLIFGWNAVQGIIEMAFAWTIAFKFKFVEYYGS